MMRERKRRHDDAHRPGGGIGRRPWGHVSRHCIYCGRVGPRVIVVGGYAHRRCIPKETLAPYQLPKERA